MRLVHSLASCRYSLTLYWVVDQCSDGNKALRLVESAVLDLNLPGLFSLEIVRRLRRTRISARIVMLSASTERKMTAGALRAGVSAFLPKTCQPGGARPPERGSFHQYWPHREHVYQPQLTGRRKNSVVLFIWLRKHAKFESALQRNCVLKRRV